MTNPIDALLAEKGVLLADGATGTNLFAMGLEAGEAPELWNESAPEKVTALHQGFVDAGADIILTNSFGGTRHRLKQHGAQTAPFDGIQGWQFSNSSERPVVVRLRLAGFYDLVPAGQPGNEAGIVANVPAAQARPRAAIPSP